MAFSRRDFVRRLGAGGAAVASASHIIGYGREELLAFTGEQGQRGGRPAAAGAAPIRLSSNENLRGPSPKVIEVLQVASLRRISVSAIRRPTSARSWTPARPWTARNRTTSSSRPGRAKSSPRQSWRTATATSRSSPAIRHTARRPQTAQRIKAPVKFIAVDPKSLALDLEGMIRASIGAGLVFLCNPNNPTSTVQTSADIEQTVRTIKQRSPETGILIDEAYLEYATKPGAFTMAKLALELPGVFVSRTFSKAYGMAGMRMGYAIGQPETMKKVGNAWGLGSINELQAVAGIAALNDKAHMQWEKMENKRVRDWTQAQFRRWASRRRSRTPTSSS